MMFGESISHVANMSEITLPIRRAAYLNECLYSFILRCAAMNGVGVSNLFSQCMPPFGSSARYVTSARLTEPCGELIAKLSDLVLLPCTELSAMVLSAKYPAIRGIDIATRGTSLSADTGRHEMNVERRISWCPQCLLEDRAKGIDHHLRRDWALALKTMCSEHSRPLNERCQNCFRFVSEPSCALYDKSLAFVCSHCTTPLDAMLGFDFVSATRAVQITNDVKTTKIWQRLGAFEDQLVKGLLSKTPNTKREKITRNVIAMTNFMLSASPANNHRPLDYVGSEHFPSVERLGQGTRNLVQPFSACHLIEQRKALGAVHSLLSGDADFFGFSEKSIFTHDLRGSMHREKLQRFDEIVYKMVWMLVGL